MFLFITSLRHPNNCHSYKQVGKLLENTLNSVCSQTNIKFKVLVVCNQKPDIKTSHNVEFLQVNFPPPSELKQAQTGMETIRIDRGSKYMAGLVHARSDEPTYVMFFDADDYVSNRIVDFVENQADESGWYIKDGYQYQSGASTLSSISDFSHHCGTSLIYPYAMLDVPTELQGNPTLPSIKAHTDKNYLKNILGSHRIAVNYHLTQGFTFKPLPFKGAIWLLGNGENHSGKKGTPGDLQITDRIRNEFSFYPEPLTL